MVCGRLGPAPQTAKREQFARLIAQGVPSAQACRIVGVNPRTGKRWRHGRTITSSGGRRLHYPPVISLRKQEISPRYLSEQERVCIADLLRQGRGCGQLRRSWVIARRRSARSCAVTVTQAVASIDRLRRSGWQRVGEPGLGGARWWVMRCCGSSWPNDWTSGGARSRSATRCGANSPTIPIDK
jgi:hypothetical protein